MYLLAIKIDVIKTSVISYLLYFYVLYLQSMVFKHFK
jgi:hypothetical protein